MGTSWVTYPSIKIRASTQRLHPDHEANAPRKTSPAQLKPP